MYNGKAGVMENDLCEMIDHWQQKGSQVSISLNDLRIKKKITWEWNWSENMRAKKLKWIQQLSSQSSIFPKVHQSKRQIEDGVAVMNVKLK